MEDTGRSFDNQAAGQPFGRLPEWQSCRGYTSGRKGIIMNRMIRKMRPLSSSLHPSKKASALITTLLVLVVLSTIVVAFMQSMSIERSVAQSLSNKERAKEAALGGLKLAERMLQVGIGTNFGYATIQTNSAPGFAPVLLVASGQNRERIMPLVSGEVSAVMPSGATNSATLSSFLSTLTNTNSAVSTDVNRRIGDYKLVTEEAGAPRYSASWIYLTSSTGETNARVCFVMVDEQSKLNLAVHGTSTNTNRIGWNQSFGSIPIRIPGDASFIANNAPTNVLLSMAPFSLAGIGNVFSNRADYEMKKHLYTFHTIPSVEIIPAGRTFTNSAYLAFPDGHKPKFNINELATNSVFGATATDRATNLAGVIDSNVSAFKSRDVAFVADGRASEQIRYVQRIAASVIDYIDSDTTSTSLPDGEPAGKELAPVITSIAEKYNWISEVGAGFSWTNRIVHTTYVQLWNPYQTNVSGSFGFELSTPTESSRFRYIVLPGAPQVPMETVSATNAVTLHANEYIVYEMGRATNTLISSVQASANPANHPRIGQTASTNSALALHTRYRAIWNNGLMDYTPNSSSFYDSRGPGLAKASVGGSSSTLIALNGTSRFSINYPQYGFTDATKGFRAVSDPRQNYLANYVWETVAQSNPDVRWNGRNNSSTAVTRQDYGTFWAARDFVRVSPRVGVSTGNADPTTAASTWTAGDATNAIGYIRNAEMKSIGELGNIYDPVHLNDVGFATEAGNPNAWYTSGGGRTLRVGQPEFSYPGSPAPSGSERRAPTWTNEDLRAITLVDLFTTVPTNSVGLSEVLGKVNINTASRNVLAALFNGIGQDGDPAFTNARLTTNSAFQIADSIISNRPYFRIGESYRFATNVLASTNFSPTLGGAATNVAAISDPGREQVLGAMLDKIDVKSQVFQVFVIGEALDSRGRVVSQTSLRAILAVRIDRTSPLAPLTSSVRSIYVQIY